MISSTVSVIKYLLLCLIGSKILIKVTYYKKIVEIAIVVFRMEDAPKMEKKGRSHFKGRKWEVEKGKLVCGQKNIVQLNLAQKSTSKSGGVNPIKDN